MSIKITHRKDWNDFQNHGCMVCHKMAVMKIEARADGNGKEWGPAQTLRLCRNHTDITYGLLQGELERLETFATDDLVSDPDLDFPFSRRKSAKLIGDWFDSVVRSRRERNENS